MKLITDKTPIDEIVPCKHTHSSIFHVAVAAIVADKKTFSSFKITNAIIMAISVKASSLVFPNLV